LRLAHQNLLPSNNTMYSTQTTIKRSTIGPSLDYIGISRIEFSPPNIKKAGYSVIFADQQNDLLKVASAEALGLYL